ncbi:hypothetical protein WN944_020236 [Citrus x changshan-huyou]|uniref:Uncharacterized protein n=2 Tax=Citrus TaxID=2706 RepID=A0A067DEH9_CITSI|nr:hypothetical protein CISIN_1g035619mg [Citrus sinensis]
MVFSAKISGIRNSLPRPEDFSKALHTRLWTEGNLTPTGYLNKKVAAEQFQSFTQLTVSLLLDLIKDLLYKFHFILSCHRNFTKKEQEYFGSIILLPIGCLPFMVVEYLPKPRNEDQNGCIKTFNVVAQEFNTQLKDSVSDQRTQLHDAVFIHVDIYSAKYTLITQAKKYGLFYANMNSDFSDCPMKLN